MNIFFSKLFEEIANIFESPFLIWEMLTMLRVGVKGESALELDDFLRTNAPEIEITANDLELLRTRYMLPVDANANCHTKQRILTIANRIFINKGTRLKQSFIEALQQRFACGIQEVDFSARTQAADTINAWVSHATHERIRDIISSHDVGANTQAVLTNAIYFKAKWQHQFETIDTRQEYFHLNCDEKVLVPMMSQTMNIRYGYMPSLNVVAIELPYRDSDLSMLVMMPIEASSWTGLVAISQLKLSEVLGHMEYRKICVKLPKFSFNCTIDVHSLLTQFGVRGIFQASQDFSNLIADHASNFSVSKIIQEAFINVTEEGTEAAAATACCIDGPVHFDETFYADRPFYFCIKNRNLLKLFDGCYRRPC
ncbi:leukocyte elastase inhibitor [Bactrocera dorsalis]|uniref:Leukocyte elastase inhibitor n=1 Tax=Bactrocera dorsalis TaxID=27457 RepID=A0ABM3JLK6_BACDO|nr:leukocyte elastase inhibitor [Bactrocera dorsalis]XP_049310116.1 leukocyte elastase inhibitor [Bactrocera dorsalis]